MNVHNGSHVLVVVGRPTFDLASAQPLVDAALASVDVTTHLAADGTVLQLPDEVTAALKDQPSTARRLVVLFASFADSRLAAAAVGHFDLLDEVVLWSLPEDWTGGRLRRNSLCGANLAAHRLVAEGHLVAGIHEMPGPAVERSIEQAVLRVKAHDSEHLVPAGGDLTADDRAAATRAVETVQSTNLGIVGEPPDGFEPCLADPMVDGVTVGRAPLGAMFDSARRPLSMSDHDVVSDVRDLVGNDHVPRGAVEHSVALRGGAQRLAERRGWNAMAIRCWPECFDEWKGAACAAMAMLNEDGVPAACEADALGAVSMRLMQSLSGEPTFLADLVEVDVKRDRLALWHCGVAPRTMAAPDGGVRIALHSNRQQPLVFDFGLAGGPVTMLRISKSGGTLALAVGEGRLTGEQPFSGTSGVVQLATSAQTMIDTMIGEGLEHHIVVAHGHLEKLVEAVAAELQLPVIHLT